MTGVVTMPTPVRARRLVWTGFKGLQIIVRTEQESNFAPHLQAQAAPNVSEKETEVGERRTLACLLLHHPHLAQLSVLGQWVQPRPSVLGRPKTMAKLFGSLFSSTKHS